jgi:poly(3-hydroxybutyrate) depolymerase
MQAQNRAYHPAAMASFTTGCALSLAALVLFCLPGCLCNDESERAPAMRPGRPLVTQPQEERRNVVVNGTARNYLLRLPRNYDKAVPAPLLVMFTEEGATSSAFEGRSDILGGAAKLGYVLAVPEPQGNGWKHDVCKTADAGAPAVAAAPKSTKPASAHVASAAQGKKQDAAAGTPDAAAASNSSENQDVAFVRALIDDVAQRYAVDAHRIYLLGTDAGAALAARAARTLSAKVAAVALNTSQSVCPSGHWDLPPSQTPVPAFLVVSGGSGSDAAAPEHPADPLGAWLEANECTAPGGAADTRVEYDCKRAPVVRVQADSGRRWPRKLGSLYTLRAVHNFLTNQTR